MHDIVHEINNFLNANGIEPTLFIAITFTILVVWRKYKDFKNWKNISINRKQFLVIGILIVLLAWYTYFITLSKAE